MPGGVQGLDRYAYVGNSPVRYTDPSGHTTECGIGENEETCNNNPSDDPDYGQFMQCSATDPRCINYYSQILGISAWDYKVLSYLYFNGGPDAQHGVNYILENGIHIKIASWQDSVIANFFDRGAWFDSNTVYLPYGTDKENLTNWDYQNIIHEALHIEQGFALSHSWEGERLAWQAGFRVYMELKNLKSYQPGIMQATNPLTFTEAIVAVDYLDYLGPMAHFYPEYPGGICGSLLFCFYISLNSR